MTTKRDLFIHFRVNRIEKEALKVLASLENRKPSELLRELIRDGLQEHNINLGDLDKEEV